MLSLIKAHCFKLRDGNWYLVFPYGESSDSWFLPARSLGRYIAFEVIAALITLGLIVLFFRTANDGGFFMATTSLLAAGSFFAHYFLLRHLMFALGARASTYRMWSLKVRGHSRADHPSDPDLSLTQRFGLQVADRVGASSGFSYGSHAPVHALLILWLTCILLAVIFAGKIFSLWLTHVPMHGILEPGFVMCGPLIAWGLVRFQKYQVRNVSVADIEPPAQ